MYSSLRALYTLVIAVLSKALNKPIRLDAFNESKLNWSFFVEPAIKG